MRKLTIKRESSWVNSRKADQVYIADPQGADAVIDNTSCRKLGDLRNGEEQTFYVGEETARIFVATGKRRISKRSDSMWIPPGEEDVSLTGTHPFMLASNGYFRFITDTSPEAVKKRKRSQIFTYLIAVLCFVAAVFIGKFAAQGLLDSGNNKAKEFNSHGMIITLTEGFKEDDYINATACFSSKDVAVIAVQEPFSLMQGFGDLTLEEYADLVMEANKKTDSERKSFNGIPGFEYDFTNEEAKKDYHYRVYTYKADNAFWTVNSVTLKKDFAKYEEKIDTWAASIRFGDQ